MITKSNMQTNIRTVFIDEDHFSIKEADHSHAILFLEVKNTKPYIDREKTIRQMLTENERIKRHIKRMDKYDAYIYAAAEYDKKSKNIFSDDIEIINNFTMIETRRQEYEKTKVFVTVDEADVYKLPSGIPSQLPYTARLPSQLPYTTILDASNIKDYFFYNPKAFFIYFNRNIDKKLYKTLVEKYNTEICACALDFFSRNN